MSPFAFWIEKFYNLKFFVMKVKPLGNMKENIIWQRLQAFIDYDVAIITDFQISIANINALFIFNVSWTACKFVTLCKAWLMFAQQFAFESSQTHLDPVAPFIIWIWKWWDCMLLTVILLWKYSSPLLRQSWQLISKDCWRCRYINALKIPLSGFRGNGVIFFL